MLSLTMRKVLCGLFLAITFSIGQVMADSPQRANTIVRGSHSEPESLDPQKIQSNPAINIVNDLFEGLVTKNRQNEIIPAQAERWTISPDQKTYTFYLKPGKWSDGIPITANDFVYAWQRAVDPKTTSPYAWYPAMAGILNAKAITENKLNPSDLGVKALDKGTLKVTLERPIPWFLSLLTHPTLFPVPQHTIQRYGDKWTQANHLVSNGAYQIKTRVINDKITLEANPYFRDAKHVSIKYVNWLPISSMVTSLHRYETDSLDITTSVPSDGFNQLKKKYFHDVFTLKQAGTEYLVFNTRKPPFNNKPLRQALSYAIDRHIITQYVLGQGQIPAYQFTPPYLTTSPSYQPFYETLPTSKRIAIAKQRYKEAGYSKTHPLTITLIYNTDEAREKLMIAIAHMWKQILGVNVQIENMEWKTLLDRLQEGDFQVARASWIADYNEASSMLGHFSAEQINKAAYSDKTYDQLFAQTYYLKQEERRKIYEKLEENLAEDMPVAPLYYYVSPRLISPRIGGYYASPLDQVYTRYLWIRPTNNK